MRPLRSSSFLKRRKAAPIGSRSCTRIRRDMLPPSRSAAWARPGVEFSPRNTRDPGGGWSRVALSSGPTTPESGGSRAQGRGEDTVMGRHLRAPEDGGEGPAPHTGCPPDPKKGSGDEGGTTNEEHI